MKQIYEKALDAIEFYQYHPEYKPFIGDKYDEHKILQIGESHYIEQLKDAEKDEFSIAYFEENWWKESGPAEWDSNCSTRTVINNYLSGGRTRAHGIFTEMVKLFSRVYTDTPIKSISKENSQAYHHFAFMNFFQMPSLYKGMSYRDSLLRSAKQLYKGDKDRAKEYADAVWEDTVQRSTDVLNDVIDKLKPEVVIFTSKSAYDAYNKQNKEDKNAVIIQTVHPGCKYWYRPNPGQTGREELERALKDLLRK